MELRHSKIRALMEQQNIDAALITCNANLFYTCGQVVIGYLYLSVHAPALLFVKRPNKSAVRIGSLFANRSRSLIC